MKILLSALLKVMAIASLKFWWAWLFSGTAYYYLVLNDSLWQSAQSGAGIALVSFIIGMLSCHISEVLVPLEE